MQTISQISPTSKPEQAPHSLREPYESIRALYHFKNSIHDGYFSSSMKRQGPGITILDNNSIALGMYRNDQNHGPCAVFLNADTYFLGEFNKGALDGPFVIRAPALTIYSSFTNNKIEGEFLVINYDMGLAQLWAVDANGNGEICKKMELTDVINSIVAYEQIKRAQNRGYSFSSNPKFDKTRFISQETGIIKNMAPYIEKIPSVLDFIKQMKAGSQQFHRYSSSVFNFKSFQNNDLICLSLTPNNNSQFLGVVINRKQELTSFGSFKEVENIQKLSLKQKMQSYENSYHLNGLGVLIEEEVLTQRKRESSQIIIYSGEFQNNELHGEGCKQIVNGKTIYGKFVQGSIRNADIIKMASQKDDQIKKLQLKRNRSIHVHSLKFYNNYTNQRPIILTRSLLQKIKGKNE